MAAQIDVETLRQWLDARQPVTVVDIRTDEDRAQWTIPGSVHINAYQALRSGKPGALANAALPVDRPIVTFCNAGGVSQTAADLLRERGFDARSLVGGMKAWSVAWNIADVLLSDGTVRIVQVRRTGKGCLSYVIGSAGQAAVVDPSISPDVYMAIARRHAWTIRYVLETHIHADHLSRARELVARAGARLVLPPKARTRFTFTSLADGEQVTIGAARIEAMPTPGHTDESTSYVINDAAVCTGDTLFTNGVGRPDLNADAESAPRRARDLWASLLRLQQLPEAMVLLPAHASEPIAFDGRAIAARMGDVSAWLSGWTASEPAFVERVTSNLPSTPPNFERIVALNETGEFPTGDPTDLEAGANRCAVR
jgi:glyoxylase-like metal-dependent hydrolase (beta-lactamase superfamily II)/rhodanese-related sulfurtransferase